jgi:hypothetical protein
MAPTAVLNLHIKSYSPYFNSGDTTAVGEITLYVEENTLVGA